MRGCLSDLAPSRLVRKARPIFRPYCGTRFPDGEGCGNCVPEYWPRMGCNFQISAQKESASHFDAGTADKSWTVIWLGLEFA